MASALGTDLDVVALRRRTELLLRDTAQAQWLTNLRPDELVFLLTTCSYDECEGASSCIA